MCNFPQQTWSYTICMMMQMCLRPPPHDERTYGAMTHTGSPLCLRLHRLQVAIYIRLPPRGPNTTQLKTGTSLKKHPFPNSGLQSCFHQSEMYEHFGHKRTDMWLSVLTIMQSMTSLQLMGDLKRVRMFVSFRKYT